MYQSHAGHNQSPGKHDDGKPDAWTESLHHHIAWDLGGDVEREEDGQGDVVVQALHTQILLEMDEAGISNVGAVEEAETVSISRERRRV